MQSALFDPQTAGGLLISINENGARKIVSEIEGAKIIGRVISSAEKLIQVS
jgi:selenophosphate synthase